ncbi:MAG TPA: PDZ domain-containing protein [Planctomycetota bacterium]|nr:PDZ domain-containing protein [Planctomycetota bacterium]
MIAGANAAIAQEDAGARIRKRLEREMQAVLETTRQGLRELVLKELSSAGIGENSLGAQIGKFAHSLVNDELHNRLKKLLLSRDGRDLVETIMAEQNVDDLSGIVESYFEKGRNGKYRIREEFEDVLAQLLDNAAPPPSEGSIGIDLLIDRANPDAKGLRVAGVTAGGPAAAAGIKAGDLLISVNGRDLASSNVEEVMKALKPGQEVKIVYERDKARKTVTVKAN